MESSIAARAASVAAVLGGAGHAAMVAGGGWMGAVGLAMAAACLPCAWHLWRRPSLTAARAAMAMSLGMALFHVAVLLAPGAGATHAHAHAASAAAGQTAAGNPWTAPMLLVIVLDFAAALTVAVWIGANRRSF
ncbi:hypothetical protein [Sinomonas halotolerans]|uniref:DUF5134 domain-containing protein n=1 Tax=Sinomonas halotolerans TaxID=1644133 RepID=A0ABU9WWT8_9MICC